jgi:hypothetical protein
MIDTVRTHYNESFSRFNTNLPEKSISENFLCSISFYVRMYKPTGEEKSKLLSR